MSQSITLDFISDAGHGWLRVPRPMINSIKMDALDFSRYSYCDSAAFYLEEDCDAGKFIDRATRIGIKVNFRDIDHGSHSPVRNMQRLLVA